MAIDFGRAPRGDPRMGHFGEGPFKTMWFSMNALHFIVACRGRVLGITDLRPRKYDRCRLHVHVRLHTVQCCQEQRNATSPK